MVYENVSISNNFKSITNEKTKEQLEVQSIQTDCIFVCASNGDSTNFFTEDRDVKFVRIKAERSDEKSSYGITISFQDNKYEKFSSLCGVAASLEYVGAVLEHFCLPVSKSSTYGFLTNSW